MCFLPISIAVYLLLIKTLFIRYIHIHAKTTLYLGGMITLRKRTLNVDFYYILWRDMGKPKHGAVCELMRKTRLHFKYMLKQCQQREDMARADAMAKSMQAKDADSFWKNVSKTYKKGTPNATKS